MDVPSSPRPPEEGCGLTTPGGLALGQGGGRALWWGAGGAVLSSSACAPGTCCLQAPASSRHACISVFSRPAGPSFSHAVCFLLFLVLIPCPDSSWFRLSSSGLSVRSPRAQLLLLTASFLFHFPVGCLRGNPRGPTSAQATPPWLPTNGLSWGQGATLVEGRGPREQSACLLCEQGPKGPGLATVELSQCQLTAIRPVLLHFGRRDK